MDDPNKRIHIFRKLGHNLEPLIRQYGGEEAAFRAIEEAVNLAFAKGNIVVDAIGLYRQEFDVGGNFVTVSGAIVGGVARIGTAWIP